MVVSAYGPGVVVEEAHDGRHRASTVSELAHQTNGWRVTPVAAGPRADVITKWRGRRLLYTSYAGGGVAFTRGASDLGDAMHGYTQIGLLEQGRVTVSRAGCTVVCEAGSVAVLRLDAEYESITEPGSRLALIHVPTDLLDGRGIETRRLSGMIWEAGEVESVIRDLCERMYVVAATAADVVEAGIIEMLVRLLGSHDTSEHQDIAAHTRMRVLGLIDDAYTQPELDAAMIARRLGVSRRYLYTLFEGRGASVAALIRNRRVAHAERLLVDEPTLALRRVAHAAGLGSEDRLLRTFKTVHGVSPSVYRRRARLQRIDDDAAPALR